MMFFVMFGPVQTGQQTASNANAPAAQVPALYTTVSDPSK
jgi:hypothetical protein